MAVTSRMQGQGVGRRLLLAAIAQFKRMNAQTLFLESSSRLTPALTPYESRWVQARPAAPVGITLRAF